MGTDPAQTVGTGPARLESGVAYRRMLSERSGFCRRLAELEIEPDGVKCPLPAEPHFSITSIWRTASWGGAAFARMGVAYANAKRRLPVAALTGDDAAMLSDADIRELLKGGLLPVVFPSDAPSAAEMLGPDGVWSPVRIRREGEATVFDAPLRFLDVAVFRLAP